MAIVFRLECRVEEWLAAAGRVEVPRPEACPRCGAGGLTFDGWYERDTRWGPVAVRRVECKACRHWPALLPDVIVWGRLDLATVIGWALERRAEGWSHRRVAAAAVRAWPGREAPPAAADVARTVCERPPPAEVVAVLAAMALACAGR